MPLRELASHAHAPLSVVVVEDHDLVREELVDFLSRPGICVRGAQDGEMLDTLLRQRAADIVVLDLNLPGEDGLSICQRMREAFPDMGLVMLTARVMSCDKTAGYQHGADVYLTKPANVDELEAVVANLSRRIRRREANGWVLDMASQKLTVSTDAVVRLSRLETRMLYELAVAPERKLSTGLLLHRLGPEFGTSQLRDNLAVSISRLRQKMTTGLATGEAIKAIRGYGYQLTQTILVKPHAE